ncbi:MAG: type II secretion system protein [Lachnospiraceae bacterium]|nr:type II secretion system protein [Lachnospiraceae bacterium]
MMKRREKNKGFTLVELIVVLVILAILAAILVPALLGYIDSARSKQTVLNARSAMTAAQAEMSTIYASKDVPQDIQDKPAHVANVKSTADTDGLGTLVLEVGCKSDYVTTTDRKSQHDAFTVSWVHYKDATGEVWYDGTNWVESTIANPNSTYKIITE